MLLAPPKRQIELELTNPAFVGPLALLLELIESKQLPITMVSLAEVADQYLERMRLLTGMNSEILADFLVTAARLLLIKSRALLPRPSEEPQAEDDAEDLERRLLEYRIFRDAAEGLRELEESGRRSYPRQAPTTPLQSPDPPLAPIRPEELRAALVRMLKAMDPNPEPVAVRAQISVKERIEQLVALLSARGRATFSEVSGATVESIVATFLAILELLRRGLLRAQQDVAFEEISISLTR